MLRNISIPLIAVCLTASGCVMLYDPTKQGGASGGADGPGGSSGSSTIGNGAGGNGGSTGRGGNGGSTGGNGGSTGGTGRPDAGTSEVAPGNSSATCPASSSDTVCGSCQKQRCCAQLRACAGSRPCTDLLACINRCAANDNPCVMSCAQLHATGVLPLGDLAGCLRTNCESACSSSSPSDAGVRPETGAEVAPPATDAGGSGAIGKFCNGLTKDGANSLLFLAVGIPPNQVVFIASTGRCAPIPGEACRAIPSGSDVPVRLYDNGTSGTLLFDGKAPFIAPGSEWTFTSVIKEGAPAVEGGRVAAGACRERNAP